MKTEVRKKEKEQQQNNTEYLYHSYNIAFATKMLYLWYKTASFH